MRSRRPPRPCAGLLSAVIASAFIALAVRASAVQPLPAAALRDLHGVDELKTWFNVNTGHVRLILLLSPT
jgi:hypothetical protein